MGRKVKKDKVDRWEKYIDRPEKKVTIGQAIGTVVIALLVAFALILIIGSMEKEEVDIVEDSYTFEYGEDALGRLKGLISADSIKINFQSENNLGYPKMGKYTGKSVRGNHEEEFTVLIEDTVAPEFTASAEELEYIAGDGSNEAVLSNFTASDISGVVEMNIQGNVDYKAVGSYPITVSATDSSRNTSTVACTVRIVEREYESANEDIQEMADLNPEDWAEYSDERSGNVVIAANVGLEVSLDNVSNDSSYFSDEFEVGEVVRYSYRMVEPGGRGSMLVGGSSVDVFRGLPSLVVGDIIDVFWEGKEYNYIVSFSGECKVDGNKLERVAGEGEAEEESGESGFVGTDNMLSVGTPGVLQLFTDYSQVEDDSIWFVKAELL